jgi:hypothetical protein
MRLSCADYTFTMSTPVCRIDYMFTVLTPVRRIDYTFFTLTLVCCADYTFTASIPIRQLRRVDSGPPCRA